MNDVKLHQVIKSLFKTTNVLLYMYVYASNYKFYKKINTTPLEQVPNPIEIWLKEANNPHHFAGVCLSNVVSAGIFVFSELS